MASTTIEAGARTGPAASGSAGEPLLALDDVVVEIEGAGGRPPARVVDGVSLAIPRGGALGLVGESGSGKSMTASAALRLLPRGARLVRGAVRLAGEDLVGLSPRALRAVRGKRVGLVVQDAATAFHPALSIGAQLVEAIRAHDDVSRAIARERAAASLSRAGVSTPEARMRALPHELSGGLRQRALLAMALALEPEVLIADEPTTALDVTLQAAVLELLRAERARGLALWLITHDLGVLAETCETIAVMYAGHLVERAPARALFVAPRHPYTAALLAARPSLDELEREHAGPAPRRLASIPGTVPDLASPPRGCRFADRCPRVAPMCREGPIPLEEHAPDHLVRCLIPLVERAPHSARGAP